MDFAKVYPYQLTDIEQLVISQLYEEKVALTVLDLTTHINVKTVFRSIGTSEDISKHKELSKKLHGLMNTRVWAELRAKASSKKDSPEVLDARNVIEAIELMEKGLFFPDLTATSLRQFARLMKGIYLYSYDTMVRVLKDMKEDGFVDSRPIGGNERYRVWFLTAEVREFLDEQRKLFAQKRAKS